MEILHDYQTQLPVLCYVPWQRWCHLYSLPASFMDGIFSAVLISPSKGGNR